MNDSTPGSLRLESGLARSRSGQSDHGFCRLVRWTTLSDAAVVPETCDIVDLPFRVRKRFEAHRLKVAACRAPAWMGRCARHFHRLTALRDPSSASQASREPIVVERRATKGE
jgi:hypothetical protein